MSTARREQRTSEESWQRNQFPPPFITGVSYRESRSFYQLSVSSSLPGGHLSPPGHYKRLPGLSSIMSSSRETPDPAESADPSASYTKMSVGDVEAIGSHCQMPFCHQLDFLPFKCESCKG